MPHYSPPQSKGENFFSYSFFFTAIPHFSFLDFFFGQSLSLSLSLTEAHTLSLHPASKVAMAMGALQIFIFFVEIT